MDTVQEDGAVGTASVVPAVNTQSTGEADIAANPPVFKRKKTSILQRTMPITRPPKSLRQILKTNTKNDLRADKK